MKKDSLWEEYDPYFIHYSGRSVYAYILACNTMMAIGTHFNSLHTLLLFL